MGRGRLRARIGNRHSLRLRLRIRHIIYIDLRYATFQSIREVKRSLTLYRLLRSSMHFVVEGKNGDVSVRPNSCSKSR